MGNRNVTKAFQQRVTRAVKAFETYELLGEKIDGHETTNERS